MSRISINLRLILLGGFLVAILAGLVFKLNSELSKQVDSLSMVSELVTAANTANDANKAFFELKYWISEYSPNLLVLPERKAKESCNRLEHYLAILEPYDPTNVAEIRKELSALMQESTRAFDAFSANDSALGTRIMSRNQAHIMAVNQRLANLADRFETKAGQTVDSVRQQTKQSIGISVIVVITGSLLGLILTIFVMRSITVPLRALITAMMDMTDGNLSTDIPPPSRDEFGKLSRALNFFRTALIERERLEKLHIQTEKEAKEQLSFLQTLIDAIPIPIFFKDTDQVYLGCNTAFEKFLGKTKSEIVGHGVFVVAPTDLADVYKAADDKLFSSGGTQVYDTEVVYADGSRHDVVFHKAVFQQSDGVAGGLVGTFLDVTERKRAEDALREKEGYLRAFVDNSPAIITLRSLDNKYLLVNKAYADSRGTSVDNALGHTARDFRTYDDLDVSAQHDRDVISADTSITRERITTFDGGKPYMRLVTKFPVHDADGKITAIGTISTDVTDRLQAEQALRENEALLRSVIDNLPAPIAIKDTNGQYIMVNKTYADRRGLPPSDVVGKSAYDLHDHDLADVIKKQEREVYKTGVAQQVELRIGGKDGVVRDYTTLKFPIWGDDGKAIGTGTVAIDISEQKDSERMLMLSKEAAEYANRAKTEFLANMSHELRTPLNAVIGFSDLMMSEAFGPVNNQKYREYIKDINQAGTHLLSLMKDILDVSRIEVGDIGIEDEIFHVRNLIEECLIMVSERAERAEIDISLNVDSNVREIRADPLRLKQIIINLLSNAIKFTGRGGQIRIDVAYENGIQFCVADTGVGIAEEDRHRVFEPFSQAETATTRAHEGTGLGLTLVKSLVEMHGGTVSLESEVGVGTTVRFQLPRERIVDVSDVA